MGVRRKVFICLALLGVFGSTVALAGPMQCPTATLQTYITGGFQCTEDGGVVTIKQFVFMQPMGGIDATQINVFPVDLPGQIGFKFLGTFVANPGQKLTYSLSFFIDPPPIIHGEQIDLDPTGAVTLNTVLCSNSIVPCALGNTITTLTATTQSPIASAPLANLNVLDVQNTFTLDGTNGAATSGGFDNMTTLTPEPAAILLTATGLLGLLAFRARTRIR